MTGDLRHVTQGGSVAVIGEHGAVSYADHGSIVYHGRQDWGGWQHNAACWLMPGGCWSDAGSTADRRRVLDAWQTGGDEAASAVLEELYRREFGS